MGTPLVFSTSVEVFPWFTVFAHTDASLLHVRGGVSGSMVGDSSQVSSSPRPWRCFQGVILRFCHGFVFSTSVEVFLEFAISLVASMGLLHVRGGVSCVGYCAGGGHRVFSTSVEVFPTPRLGQRIPWRLLHVRGGVSFSARCHTSSSVSSPRPWRCFYAVRHPRAE